MNLDCGLQINQIWKPIISSNSDSVMNCIMQHTHMHTTIDTFTLSHSFILSSAPFYSQSNESIEKDPQISFICAMESSVNTTNHTTNIALSLYNFIYLHVSGPSLYICSKLKPQI